MMLKNSRPTPIGLELAGDAFRAAQLVHTRSGVSLRSAVNVPKLHPGKPWDQAELARVADVLARHGFVGQRVIANLPSEWLKHDLIELPLSQGAPTPEIVREKIAESQVWDVDAFTFSAWALPTQNPRVVHLATAACLSHHIDQLGDLLHEQGLVLNALDTKAAALTRSLRQDKAHATVLLDLEWHHAHLMLVDQGVVFYERDLPELGLSAFRLALAKATGLKDQALNATLHRLSTEAATVQHVTHPNDPADTLATHSLVAPVTQLFARQLAHELGPALSYVQRQFQCDAGHVVGVTGDLTIAHIVEDALNAALQSQAPAWQDPHTRGIAQAGAVAVGLALHDVKTQVPEKNDTPAQSRPASSSANAPHNDATQTRAAA